MALTYVQFTGDGTTDTFGIPFPYLTKDSILASIDGVSTDYTWNDVQTIKLAAVPANGAVIDIRRSTPRETRMVDFVDGSVLTENDLDTADLQVFYIVQEAIDIAGGTLELKPDGSYGAGLRRITEVAPPVDEFDAVNKGYYESTFLPQMQALLDQTTTLKNATDTNKTATDTALAAAVAARDLAQQYRDTTKGYRDEVQGWNTNVNAKSANVDAKSANVDTKSANVDTKAAQVDADMATTLGYRNEAEGFKNDAAASAAAAQTWDPTNYIPKTGEGFGQFGFRNRIINGTGRINQRGYGYVNTFGAYHADRWFLGISGVAGLTGTSDGAVSNNGSTHLSLISEAVKASPAAGDFLFMSQRIEGVNVADLKWGTASAKPITVSFRAEASVGSTTIAVSVRNADASLSYVALVTIANTPTNYTIVIPGCTTGTWDKGTYIGIELAFCGVAGANFQAPSPNTWASGNYVGAAGMSNLVDTYGRFINITDVQLEAGSVATPYEVRPYSLELALCQRYYWRGLPLTDVNYPAYIPGAVMSWAIMFPQTMRIVPSLSISFSGVLSSSQAPAVGSPTKDGCRLLCIATAATSNASVAFAANDFIAASAEL